MLPCGSICEPLGKSSVAVKAVDYTNLRMVVIHGKKFIKDCQKRKEKWRLLYLARIPIGFMPSLKVILSKKKEAYLFLKMQVKIGSE